MFDLIDYIDLVQESVNDSDAEVLMAMAASYTKSLQIMESASEDSELYDSIFQEEAYPVFHKPNNSGDPVEGKPKNSGAPVEGKAKNSGEYKSGTPDYLKDSGDDKKEDNGKLRKTNFFVKALRFIKRLWQQIITMVSSQMTKHSVKKAKKALSNAKGDRVKSPFDEDTLQDLIENVNDMKKHFESFGKKDIDKEDLITTIGYIVGLALFDKKDYEDANADHRKMKMDSIASKQTIIKYFDDSLSAFNVARSAAKNVDRIIDEWIDAMSKDDRKDFESMMGKDHIQKLNNASSRIFKMIRFMYEKIRIETNFFIKDKKNLDPKEEKAAAAEETTSEYATMGVDDVFNGMIMESYEVTHWSAYFMEGADNGELRSKNFVAKTVRFIKRLWQQIITMVSSQLMNHTVKKAIKKLKDSKDAYVKCPYPNNQLDAFISGYGQQAADYEKAAKDLSDKSTRSSMSADDWNGIVKDLLAILEDEVQPILKNEDEKIPDATASVSKETLIKTLETVQKWVPAITSFAKLIDKIIDNSTLTKEDIKSGYAGYNDSDLETLMNDLNKMSSKMFKYVRVNCAFVRNVCKSVLGELKKESSAENKADSTAAEPAAATA